MMGLLQRVRQARVEVAGEVVGQIGPGLLALVCAEQGDGEAEADRLLAKLLKLRIFADAAGKMNLSLQDVAGGLLIVSQFTLAADTTSGNRPGFSQAATPAEGEHRRSASSMKCVVSRMDLPCCSSVCSRSHIRWRACGSRPVVGSSSSSRRGSLTRARASDRRRRMPPESWPGRASALGASAANSSSGAMRASMAAPLRPK